MGMKAFGGARQVTLRQEDMLSQSLEWREVDRRDSRKARRERLKGENLRKSILPDIVIKLYYFHNFAVYKTRQRLTNQSFLTVSLKTPKVIHDIYFFWV
jgi:hypothetical protein